MPDDLMRYDLLAQHALRGVVREALRVAETTGLPGEHHFYIAFNTKFPGVEIGERLSARYPREMTIVLQHQFDGLKVHDDRFEVKLSFDNIPERLIVPFDAVKGFLDPAVQFGLQFESVVAPKPLAKAPEAPVKRGKPEKVKPVEAPPEPATSSPAQGEAPKVISLDSFRKK
jgi:hypothetical protein